MNVMPFDQIGADTVDLLRATIRRFVRERLVPLEASVARDEKVPPSVVNEMRELGLFGISIPEEYGGLGLTMAAEVQVIFEMDGHRRCFDRYSAPMSGSGRRVS